MSRIMRLLRVILISKSTFNAQPQVLPSENIRIGSFEDFSRILENKVFFNVY